MNARTINGHGRLNGDPSVSDRLPPHNKEAERALIGTMLREPSTIPQVSQLVRADDYYVFGHRKIHEVIVELHQAAIAVDTVTLAEALTNRRMMDDVGGVAYIAELWDATPAAAHYRNYAEIIAQYSKRRRMIQLGADLCKWAIDLGEHPDETLNSVAVELSDIRDGCQRSRDIEALTLPGGTWPVLGDAAYYGIVGDIVANLEPETEADPVGILVQLLISLGNVIGRTAYSRVEGDKHFCNLFGVGVGKSGHGRKGTSWGRVRQVMAAADGEWVSKCIGSGLSSGEGLIQRLRDSQMTDDGETQTFTRGVIDKRLLAVETEFGSVLKVLKRDGNTLSAILRNAWDTGDISTLTKSPVIATNVHVSILAHITEQELRKCFDEVDVFNGFANRFLWFLVKRSKLLPEGGRAFDLGPLGTKLNDIIIQARRLEQLDRADTTREMWAEAYPKLTAGRPGLAGIVTSRAEGQVLRIATLYAALDCSSVIMPVHLQAALAIWAYCEESARQVFGCEDKLDRITQLVLDKLHEAGDRGMSRTQLSYAVGRHIPNKRVVEALALLRDMGKARCEEVSSGDGRGGRPTEWWFRK